MKSPLGKRLGGALLALVLAVVVEGGDAHAAERATADVAPQVSAKADDVQIARRRSRQKNQRKRSRAAKPPPVEPATPGEQAPAAQDAAVDAATRRGPTRVEFDERLLQGQTNKANAIYLFQRRESALRSLVKKREHFHAEIDEALE